ncbi:MAG: RNA polymerase sigma factor [Gemmatimonadetes bacterium]|nr:RNA polymerase sigma factor [Gemmatimonadota bacterium]
MELRFPAAPAGAAEIEDLVLHARGGDLAAFDRLYYACVGRVYALCLRMAGSADDAERLTQDVFVRAWEKLPLFRGESKFTSWLHRLAVNVVLRDRRGTWRRERRLADAGGMQHIELAGNREAAPELRLDLERAVAALPPRARAVLVLHDIEGYRHDEIAALLRCAVGTSKAQLHRARRLLRQALER